MDVKTWIPIYIGDYLADTQHLSTEEHGAYFLLIMYYWRTGHAIKNDKILIKNITKLSQKKLKNVLAFFEEKNGLLFHKRIEAELSNALEKNNNNKERVVKATAARLQKQSKNDDVTNNVTSDVASTPSPSPSPSPIDNDNKLSLSIEEEELKIDDDFLDKKIKLKEKEIRTDGFHKPFGLENYYQIQTHPKFNEVWNYIISRLPSLKTRNATEINRWLNEGISPPEIYQHVDFCISVASSPIHSFKYFSDAILSSVNLKKELKEQEERMRKKYAKPE